jgi:hypothetical protein
MLRVVLVCPSRIFFAMSMSAHLHTASPGRRMSVGEQFAREAHTRTLVDVMVGG